MIIRGLRNIGLHMGVSPMSILRWHRKYDDNTFNFPLVPIGSGIGNSINYITNTELINQWLMRLSYKDSTRHRMNMRGRVRMAVCKMAFQGSARPRKP